MPQKKTDTPNIRGVRFIQPLAGGTATDLVAMIAAAQQDQDPDPGRTVAPTVVAAAVITVAAQAQQQDDPDDTVFVTAKSTHKKIPP